MKQGFTSTPSLPNVALSLKKREHAIEARNAMILFVEAYRRETALHPTAGLLLPRAERLLKAFETLLEDMGIS